MSKDIKNKNTSPCFLHGLSGVRDEADGVQILVRSSSLIVVLESSKTFASWYYYVILLNTEGALCPLPQTAYKK